MRKLVLALDQDDQRLLAWAQLRTGQTATTVLRWALRWYCYGGPWREPDEAIPPEIVELLRDLPVGEKVLKEVSK